MALAAFLALPWSAAGQNKVRKRVRIESTPSGANIWLDGKAEGVTPIQREFPLGYFQPQTSVIGRHLSKPLDVTVQLDGYHPVTAQLGYGPYTWYNNWGIPLFDFYLLDTNYNIPLTPLAASSETIEGLNYLDELERLAKLRDSGALTDEEFQERKQIALSRPSAQEAAAEVPAPIPAVHIEPSICPLIVEMSLPPAILDLPEVTPTALEFASRKGKSTRHFYAEIRPPMKATCQRSWITRIRFGKGKHRKKGMTSLEIAPLVRLAHYLDDVTVAVEVLARGEVKLRKTWTEKTIEDSHEQIQQYSSRGHQLNIWLNSSLAIAKSDLATWWDGEAPLIRVTVQ